MLSPISGEMKSQSWQGVSLPATYGRPCCRSDPEVFGPTMNPLKSVS